MIFSEKTVLALQDALPYLKIAELKRVCEQLQLPTVGYKADLIERIMTFVSTGVVTVPPVMPTISKGTKGMVRVLAPHERMLHGVYKNDAATRAFFKHLIGKHFHFTSFGVDWLNEQWYSGNPPTYAEFAAFWSAEYAARKHKKATPKKEWALLNFVQRFLTRYPHATRDMVFSAWKQERQWHVEQVAALLKVEI